MNKVQIDIDGRNRGAITAINGVKRELLGLGPVGNQVSSMLSTMLNPAFLISAGLTGAVAGISTMIKSSIDLADEMSKTSQRIGISVEALSTLKYAADLADVSFEQLQTGIGRLSRNMFDLSVGVGQTAKYAFDALSLSVMDSTGNLRNAEDILLEVADKFSQMEDGTKKTAIAMTIFGRAGAQLIPLLNAGKDGIKELQEEARKLGLEISTKTARQAEIFNDNLTTLKSVGLGVANVLIENLLPSLVITTNSFKDIVTEGNMLPAVFSALGSTIKALTSHWWIFYGALEATTVGLSHFIAATIAISKTDLPLAQKILEEGFNKTTNSIEKTIERLNDINNAAEGFEDIVKRIRAEQELLADQKAAEKLAADWLKLSTTLQNDIIAAGLSPQSEKLFRLNVQVEEMRAKYGQVPGALILINSYLDTMLEKMAAMDELQLKPRALRFENPPIEDTQFEMVTPDFNMEQLQLLHDQQIALAADVTSQEAAYLALREGHFTDTLGNMANAMSIFANLSQNTNKTLFGVYKAFAIGEAGIATFLAATKAYEQVPFPFNFIAAAAVTAAGLANIARIASMQPGSGVGGASLSAPPLPPVNNISNTTNNNQNNTRQLIVNVYGPVDDDELARRIIPAIERAYSDGGGGR